jgi:hydrogenase maturation factor
MDETPSAWQSQCQPNSRSAPQTSYPLGKLPADHLAQLLTRYQPSDPRVVLGPGVGRDAAVVAFGDRYLVAKTDPITFASDEIGWYAVHVNANDVACTGATAHWFLATLLLPEDRTAPQLVDTIVAQIADACRELDVALVGGHTEISSGLDRPIVIGCMLGEVSPSQLVRPDGARPGDVLLVTKGVAVEGTAIIAREQDDRLAGLDATLLERSRQFLYAPGISVVHDAAVAVRAGEVHAMHDPTEGGLATGLWELSEAAEVGLVIDRDAIPVLPETEAVCSRLGLDPLGLIASGALLLAVASKDASAIMSALEKSGIQAAQVGHVVERQNGVYLYTAKGKRPLPRFSRDEIAQLYE